jgi:hypothetical protein
MKMENGNKTLRGGVRKTLGDGSVERKEKLRSNMPISILSFNV